MDYTSTNIGILKYVPGGTYQRDATPANTSSIVAFRMSVRDITRAQFVAITGLADPSSTMYSTGTTDPVQKVNWYHTMVFCNKLSIAEGLTPVYIISGTNNPTSWGAVPTSDNTTWDAAIANWSATGYRLPTETEWMWAAMGADTANPGQVNTSGYTKAFSGSTGINNIGDYAWTVDNTGKTQPVGTKYSNELGIFDLSGNVSEWCWDWYDVYPAGSLTNYYGAAPGTYRITRGGNWAAPDSSATVAYRDYYNPEYQGNFIGFRVVRP